MRQLLGVVRPRPPLEDDLVIGVDDVEVANPAAGDPVDVALDELGEFLVALADAEATKLDRWMSYSGMPVSHFVVVAVSTAAVERRRRRS